VHGVAGALILSLLINENLSQKTLSEQTALVSIDDLKSNISFIRKETIS
jgi:pantothenate kinase-related protein Tda10